MKVLLIREYQSTEAETINALALEAFAQYEEHYDDWPEFRAKIGNMAALADSGSIFVAENGGNLLGAVCYLAPGMAKASFFEREWAVMRMLVVRPSERRQNVGRALTETCLNRAWLDGAGILALHTSPIMQAAGRLYNRMGFRYAHAAPDIAGVQYHVCIHELDEENAPWRASQASHPSPATGSQL